MLGDRETQSGAAHLARARNVDAIKSLKNPGLLCLWNADSGVQDRKDHLGTIHSGADHDLSARRRVLNRVVQKILQSLGQPAAISGDVWKIRTLVHRKPQVLFTRSRLRGFHAALNEG